MGKKKKVKGIKKLTDEMIQIVENAWYQYDEDGSETLDFEEVLTIMTTMHGEEFPEEDCKELYEKMDDDGDKKVSYTEYTKHIEKILKKHPAHTVDEMLARLAKGPPGSEEWVKRDARSEEEEKALRGLQAVKYLLKPEMLDSLRRHHDAPKHTTVVCNAAMGLLGVGKAHNDWHTIQHWLKGGEDLVWKLSSFHKRIDCGQVPDMAFKPVRKAIVDTPDAFRADKFLAAHTGHHAATGQCAAQLANWVLICVRYFDAVRTNMEITLQNQSAGGIAGPSFAAAVLPIRDALPKALESWHVHKVPILYDPKGLATQILKYKKAKVVDAVDPRHFFKDALLTVLCSCMEQGVPLVINYAEASSADAADLMTALEGVQPGLYTALLEGKGGDAAFVQALKGDPAASLKNVGQFAIYLLTQVQCVPTWIPEDGYVTIEVR